MALQIRRGVEADRTSITPAVGEPIYTTDNKELFIGDGTTPGGVAVGGGGTLTVDTQDFTASGTWTKPANAVWVEVTMCGGGVGGEDGSDTVSGYGGAAGRPTNKTFLASALGSTVSVTCGAAVSAATQPTSSNSSSFGTYLYAPGGGGPTTGWPASAKSGNIGDDVSTGTTRFGEGGGEFSNGAYAGNHGFAFGPGGGGSGGSNSVTGQAAGYAGGLAASGRADDANCNTGGGGAGGASAATGSAGTAGGYDTITGFGNGGGGGGEGTGGAGGAGGAAVRGGGGGGGGMGTTAGGAGGAGGAGFVRVRTLCFG